MRPRFPLAICLVACCLLAACDDGSDAPDAEPAASAPASASTALRSASAASGSDEDKSYLAVPGQADMAVSQPPAAAAPASGAASAVRGAVMRGVFIWGPEVETLNPCGSNKTFWLEGDDAVLDPLEELALEKADAANAAYQPVYVEVQVADRGRATDGFAVDYDGVLEVQRVVASSKQVPADCALLPAAAVTASRPAASKPARGPAASASAAHHG